MKTPNGVVVVLAGAAIVSACAKDSSVERRSLLFDAARVAMVSDSAEAGAKYRRKLEPALLEMFPIGLAVDEANRRIEMLGTDGVVVTRREIAPGLFAGILIWPDSDEKFLWINLYSNNRTTVTAIDFGLGSGPRMGARGNAVR